MSGAPPRRFAGWLAGVAVLLALAGSATWVAWRNVRGESPVIRREAEPPRPADAARLAERGAYLARVGNCAGCHTERGGEPYAGGRGIATPFGTVYASNLTPDAETGLGQWSRSEFWRAMRHGRSRDGRLLYPAFPYPNFTRIRREDSDALFAFLQRLPPARQANRAHELRFPYSTQTALAVWRALYFRPARFVRDDARGAEWNRGRYLVEVLGHCTACHAARNVLGATVPDDGEPSGSIVASERWYAPSLHSSHEAGVQAWSDDEVVALLKTGISPRGWAMGPMADVVFRSTQHLDDADLRAISHYLRSLPAGEGVPKPAPAAPREVLDRGAKVYERHCASCHGDRGQGTPEGQPPLAGNRAVVMASAHNVVQAVRQGGFAPTTAGNPRPFGMPPFAGVLSDEEIAAVASYLRQSWGHAAPEVRSLDVLRTP